jgi:hypothetical protein
MNGFNNWWCQGGLFPPLPCCASELERGEDTTRNREGIPKYQVLSTDILKHNWVLENIIGAWSFDFLESLVLRSLVGD